MDRKVSIVVPVFNASGFITKTIENILSQSYSNFEIIVVNDCSTDSTKAIISQSSNKDNRIKVINHDKNLGVSGARNTGIENCQGDFIFFMDTDDEFYNEQSLSILINNIDPDSDFCLGGTYFVKNGKPEQNNYHSLKNSKDIYVGNEIFRGYLNYEWASVVWNKLYKTDFILRNNVKFAEGLLHEDELFCFETASLAKKINFIDSPTYIYNYLSNPHSIINSGNYKNYFDMKNILFKMIYISSSRKLDKKFPNVITYLENYAMSSILARLLHDEKIWKKVYSEISAEFRKYNFPNQKYFRKPAFLAYPAYKSRYDSSYRFYKKYPEIFARLL